MRLYTEFKTCLIIVFAACCLYSCDSGKTKRELLNIEALLDEEKVDSASNQMTFIMENDLKGEENIALYNLLKTRIDYLQYKNVPNDSLIDLSINYFKKSGDKDKLSDSYYYKGSINLVRGKLNEAIVNYKQAELNSRTSSDASLRHKVLEGLSYTNEQCKEYTLAIKYSKANETLSRQQRNYNWLTYALGNLAVEYYHLGMVDSSLYYMNQCEPFLKFISKEDRALFFANIGNIYEATEPSIALKYLERSIKIKPTVAAYQGLANLNREKPEASITFLNKAVQLSKGKIQTNLLLSIADFYKHKNNFEQAYKFLNQAYINNDSVNAYLQSSNIRNIQMHYDQEFDKFKYKRNLTYIACFFSIIVLILLAVTFYRRNKFYKVKETIQHNQLLISTYNQQIENLEKDNGTSTKLISALKLKLADLQSNQSSILYRGKQLYEGILNNNTPIGRWGHNEFVWFLNYYKLVDLPYMNYLETNYDGLTPKNMFFMVLYHMNKSDQEVQDIMGISSSTVRANKSRLKKKEISIEQK